ncbi:hypothetical protein DAEQUDRAFT_728018 [Daedalea quercina L-15889]|uniref:Uncharacterized protein n=1 Tax=Daedalea quercina L-15889 TaxID=1314783 RepID=A0A165PNH9_9APHY|nr:hypothetical protein DAEQUDRAFT_728018 [Daedalea quercina L-15889]
MSCVQSDGIAALNLARLLPGRETDDMLASAIYMCCQLDINTIVNGVLRADGMVEHLRPADIVLCIQARMNMLHENLVIATRVWQPATDPDCTTTATGECLKLLGAASLEYQSFKKSAGLPASLAEWYISIILTAGGCCKPCTAMLKDRALEERKVFWRRAREIMGLA